VLISFRPRLVSGPFIDASFHLLVRDDTALFDVVFSFSHRCEKCDFICRIAIIDVVWKSIDRLKNLFFNAHDARLAETESVRNAGKIKFAVARPPSPAREPRLPGSPNFGSEPERTRQRRALPRNLAADPFDKLRAGSARRYNKKIALELSRSAQYHRGVWTL
jgi:hypothetical protein